MAGPNHSEGVALSASAPPTPTLADLSGTTLEGRYELGSVLGTGGMGAVFEAKHLLLGRPVAIKVLRPIFVDHDEYIERFLREARAASMIRHRNVVEILDFGRTSSGLVYSVMELLHGQDLHKILKSQAGSRLPWAHACGLLVQIANGLKAAHARGVIHRDIKPANCFVTEDDDGEPLVKVVDFGVAKLDDVDQAQQLTSTAQLLGTPNYIAPELVRTKSPASPRSDIYSLGVLAYRVLTGHVPFSGDTIFEVLRLSCFEPVPSLCDQVPGLPPAVEALVLQMLAKEPDERPQDMLAVREALLALGRTTLGTSAGDIPTPSAISLGLPDLVSELASDLRHEPAERAPTDPEPHRLGGRVRTDVSTMVVQLERASVAVAAPAGLVPSVGTAAPEPPVSYPSFAAPVAVPHAPQLVVAAQVAPRAQHPPKARGSSSRLAWVAFATVLGAVATVALALWITTPAADEARVPDSPASPKPVEAAVEPPAPTPEPQASPALVPSPPATSATVPSSSAPAPSDAHQEPAVTVAPTPPPAPSAPKPKLGPSDGALEKKLTNKIKERCGSLMKGGSLEVTIIVADDGEVVLTKTNPNDAAGRCAAAQVKDTKFRKRSGEAKVVFTVK